MLILLQEQIDILHPRSSFFVALVVDTDTLALGPHNPMAEVALQ